MSIKRSIIEGMLKGVEVCFLSFVRLGVTVLGYRSIKVGHCAFWGPPWFNKIAESAFLLLEEKDPAMSDYLKDLGGLFWYNPNTRSESGYSGVFTITDDILTKGAEGVMGKLVWAYFKSKAFRGRYFFPAEREIAEKQLAAVRRQTEEWLANHGIAENIILVVT